MTINFLRLATGPGGKPGGREVFERLVVQIVGLRHPTVRRIEANPGDWGIDALVGELDEGVVSVWQSKYFIDGVGEGQKSEIRASLSAAVNAAKQEGVNLEAWTLCLPCSMDGPTTKWWDNWKRRQERAHSISISLWDETALERMLIAPEAEALRSAYFSDDEPEKEIPVLPLPHDVDFDEMLFIKQLRAANVAEVESAKQQFFNADILSREVADKAVPDELAVLESSRSQVHALWETRFNEKCASCDPSSNQLAGLHPDVMKSIEDHHARNRDRRLPMTLIHRLGSVHELVELGGAGWVRRFREIAEAHRG